MKYSADLFRRLHWIQLPGAFLIALLQRTPVLRVVETASDFVLRSPAASVLKAAAATFGAMGAVHSLAGATTLSASSPSPTSAIVGTTKTVVFSAIGAQSAASSWTVGGSVPPGLTFNGGATSGTVNTPSPTLLTLTGIPTTAGTYVISLRAWEKINAGGAGSPTFSYTVTVTGGAVATAPSFTTQPSAQTVTAGGSATFTVAASGSPTPTYQWQKNGGALAGKTGSTLSLSNVQAADAGSYTCVATNSAGSATSSAAPLTVSAAAIAPAFTIQPSSQTVAPAASATFTVAASGTPTPTYQWRKDGGALAGQTATTLSLSNIQAADAGSYTCVATNSAGSVTSSAATLTVSAAAVAPAFTTQPVAQSASVGAAVTFTIAASGTPTPTYQWRKDGGALAGQTGTMLSLSSVQVADAGSYSCVATNSAGATVSFAASLTVNALPVFTTQPVAQSALSGTAVTFTVATSGTPAPTYQWRKNGSALAGQTGTTLTLGNVQTADAGSYTCVATNSAGFTISSAAALTVSAAAVAPAFTTQPSSQTVTAGAPATFVVAASGTPTPALQWRKDGSPLAGQTGATLTLNNTQSADAGSYTCVATNSAGTVTSSAATLAVNAAGPQSVISNVSVRTTLEAAQTLIVGFTMQGGSKSVLVRAVGPGLANFGVGGAMFDPRLALYRGSEMLMQNDNWGGGSGLSTAFSRVGAFPLTPASLDAAVMRSVEGGHTVQITGSDGGNVLVEAYDAGTGAAAHLVNVSARNRVGTGGDILIAGFTIGGTGSRNLLVRAVGPTLAVFGVPGALVAPKLEIYNTAGEKIAENAGWAAALASAFSSVGAFPLTAGSHDAALTISLPPGGYTVQVAGADGGTGEALVELYELP